MISEKANQLIETFAASLSLNGDPRPSAPLYAGVDLGTAYIVTAVVDDAGNAGCRGGYQQPVKYQGRPGFGLCRGHDHPQASGGDAA